MPMIVRKKSKDGIERVYDQHNFSRMIAKGEVKFD